MSQKFYARRGKRSVDFALATSVVVIVAPVFLLIALMVRFRLGTPVLFRHQRPGYHGKPFTLLKFRTMTNDVDDAGILLPDTKRMTTFGRFLRSTSLDELPELFNVLKGEMSLVGPRPLLMQYLGLYSSEQMRRHNVRPGITGWAQVHGRNSLPWEQRFVLDVWYVDHLSLWLDLKIIMWTVWEILRREGISQPGYVSAEEFKGSNQTV
jgi:sugar transferase EpsL